MGRDRGTPQWEEAGRQLAQHLARAGLSQQQLANGVGVGEAAVSSWVHGRNRPRNLDKLKRWFDAQGTPLPETLLELWDPPPARPKRSSPKRSWVIAAGVFIVLVVGGIAVALVADNGDRKPSPSTESPEARDVRPESSWTECKKEDVYIRKAPDAIIEGTTPVIRRGEQFIVSQAQSHVDTVWLEGAVKGDPERKGWVPASYFCRDR